VQRVAVAVAHRLAHDDPKGVAKTMKFKRSITAIALSTALAFGLSACGSSTGDRGLSGAGIGAAGGAVIGAMTGSTLAGAAIGAAAGAATGILTDDSQLYLGKAWWK